MDQEIMTNEVIANEVTENAVESVTTNNSVNGWKVAAIAGAVIIGGRFIYKKLLKPGFAKIKKAFTKKEEQPAAVSQNANADVFDEEKYGSED